MPLSSHDPTEPVDIVAPNAATDAHVEAAPSRAHRADGASDSDDSAAFAAPQRQAQIGDSLARFQREETDAPRVAVAPNDSAAALASAQNASSAPRENSAIAAKRASLLRVAAVGIVFVGGLSAFALVARRTQTDSAQNAVSNAAPLVSSTRNAVRATPQAAPAASLPSDSLSSILQRLKQTQKLIPKSSVPQTPPATQPDLAPNAVAPNAAAPNAAAANAVETIFNRAVAAQKAGRSAEALSSYRQVLSLRADILPARVNLALLLLQMKRPEEALPQLQAARKLDPKNPSLPWQIAQTLMQLKRPQEALEPLRAVVALAPRDVQSRGALAQLLAASGKQSEALTQWKALAALAPQSADAAFNAGSLSAELKNWDDAETWLRRAKTIVDKTAPRDPRPTLQLARVLAQRGKTSDEQTLLESGARRFPKVVEISALLSDVRLARGDGSGAVEALQNALPQVPASVESGVPRARLLAAIARLQENRKKPQEAANAWSQATKLLPRDADLRAFYATSLMRSGDRTQGVAQFRQALQLEPKRNDLRLTLARALFDTDRFADANIEYSKLLQIKPNNPALLSEQAQVLEKQKKYGQAAANWNRIETMQPDKTAPILENARLLRAAGRDDEALSKYRQTLQLEASQPDALLGAAQLEEKTGQGARALAHWRALVAARPTYFPAYQSLLANAAKRRQTTATVNFLRPILAKQPENPLAFDAVLSAYQSEGTPEIGRAFIRQFIEEHPTALAPQRALARFDLQNAKRRLQTLRNADSKLSSTRTPQQTPTATPLSAATPPTATPPTATPLTATLP